MLVFKGGGWWCWCRCQLYSAKFALKLAGEVGVVALRVGTTLENEHMLHVSFLGVVVLLLGVIVVIRKKIRMMAYLLCLAQRP
jgi:hypothetical protein